MRVNIYIKCSIFFYILVSCDFSENKSESTLPIIELNIKNSLKSKEKELFLSDLTNEVSYVSLETTDLCLLNRIHKLYLTDDYIIISDANAINQFNKSGKFIRQIGNIGRGPGEYSGIIRFTVDTYRGRIFVFSTSIMNIYDLDTGVYKSSYEVDIIINDFAVLPDGKFVFYTRELPPGVLFSTPFEVYLADNNGKLIDSIANNNRLKLNDFSASGIVNLYKDKECLYYIYSFQDTLYHISKDFVRRPYIVFNLGNSIKQSDVVVIPTYADIIQFPEFIWLPKVLENQQYVLITYNKGIALRVEPISGKLVYDKKTGNIVKTSGFINDIDGGMTFWPQWVCNGVLIEYYQPYQILDYYNETKGSIEHSEEFINLVNSLNEDDNPVLVLVK